MSNFQDVWERALKHTEIIRSRVSSLQTFSATHVPYVFLAESSINAGDTVVRKGEVVVEKPSLILPPNIPQLEGFDFEDGTKFDDNALVNFLMIRGISLPSMRYDNRTNSLDIYEGSLSKAINHYNKEFQRMENVSTGLIAGPEDVWQMSLLIFVCLQIARNTEIDIRRLMDEYKKEMD